MTGTAREELRIALAMTGGVSLAVWIGGVANEVNRLRLRDSSWGPLLDVLDQDVVVDLVSGTSAGGLNGALLGAAMAGRIGPSLVSLRELWLKEGDFEKLLRRTSVENPPSLMDGDGYFLPRLREAFTALLPRDDAHASELKTFHLYLTMTLVDGRARRYADALGTRIDELDHRGTMHFTGAQLFPSGNIDRDALARALALAARSSASFPFAFEASWIPIAPDDPKSADLIDADHPDMSPYSWWRESGYALDGGLVLNRPLKPLITAMPDQPAGQGSVRRVLLYVSPNPEGTITPKTQTRTLPTIVSVGEAIAGARFAQSIADDYEALRAHNDEVEREWSVADQLRGIGDSELRTMAARFARTWRKRRAVEFAQRVTTRLAEDRVLDAFVSLSGDGPLSKALIRSHSEALKAALGADPQLSAVDPNAVFGLDHAPVDRALRTAQWLARNALRVSAAPDAGDKLLVWRSRLGALGAELRALDEEQLKAWVDAIRAHGGDPDRIGADEITQLRPVDVEAMQVAKLRDLVAQIEVAHAEVGALVEEHRSVSDEPDSREQRVLDEAEAAAPRMPDPSALRTEPAYLLARGLNSFVGLETLPSEPVGIHTVLVDIASAPLTGGIGDEIVDLIQISADAGNVFDDRTEPARKLTGLQLHHFGAFYKSSWRANDWMWGRLDGAMQLVRTVLDPDRLYYRYREQYNADSETAIAHIVQHLASAATGISALTGGTGRTLDQNTLAELPADDDTQYLCDELDEHWTRAWDEVQAVFTATDERPPLACTVQWIARRLQLEVLRVELPVVAEHALSDHDRRDDMPAALEPFLKAAAAYTQSPTRASPPEPPFEACVQMFLACRVGEERLEDQVTSTRFLATSSHAFATGVNGLSGTSAPGPIRPLAAGLRGIAKATSTVARLVVSTSTIAVALLTALVVGSAAVVAVSVLRHPHHWPLIASAATAALIGAFVAAAWRTPPIRGASLTAALTLTAWGAFGILIGSWAGDLIQVIVALVGAALLVGVLSNLGRSLFVPTGQLSRVGWAIVLVALGLVGFALWQASTSVTFHAGHETGACAVPARAGSVTTTTISSATTTTVAASKQSVVCVTISKDSTATLAAILGSIAVILVLGSFVVGQRRKRRKRRHPTYPAPSAKRRARPRSRPGTNVAGAEQPVATESHAHPGPRLYVLIAVVLVVLTVSEVSVSYLNTAHTNMVIWVLGVLAATKFFLVAAWYMHMKQDAPFFRRVFLGGMVGATIVYGIVMLVFSSTVLTS